MAEQEVFNARHLRLRLLIATLDQQQIDQIRTHFLSRSRGIVMIDLDGHLLDKEGRLDESCIKSTHKQFSSLLNRSVIRSEIKNSF
jgi:hypothetical protein